MRQSVRKKAVTRQQISNFINYLTSLIRRINSLIFFTFSSAFCAKDMPPLMGYVCITVRGRSGILRLPLGTWLKHLILSTGSYRFDCNDSVNNSVKVFINA
ncbi:MAG: hypothetical protein M0R47_16625 [Methylobacter sp.]|nr:hypothetical protein [Methylobacter sp.]